ncbi:mfs general substrate transporter [Phaffia rhodozyma]|uniref:Mfs general substrate transporter n=1 Tax=Phaffia rhodozyma TaxID=264483 RepID=A0A0F7SGM1_PHARH|nr:mfs general substrate transporter [Phaffia rhodozyma]
MSSPTTTLHSSPSSIPADMLGLAPPLANDLSSAEKAMTGPPTDSDHPALIRDHFEHHYHKGNDDENADSFALRRLPTVKDIRADSKLLETRRQRTRTLSQSGRPKDLALNRALSRISNPPIVGPTGGVSLGDGDESGLPPVRDSEEADRNERERIAEIEKEDKDHQVTWDGPDDKANPKNWSAIYRWILTVLSGILVLNATFASSAPSGVISQMIVYFEFSQEVATLLIAIFVAGYCVGPLLWGPLSETYGRRPTFLISFFVYSAFQIGCALAKNTASILIFRFISGCFAACPLTNSGALISDIWDADRRGIALAFFSLAPFAGPALGPIVGGFISTAGVSWRVLYWVLFAFAGLCFVLCLFFIPETYAPIILAKKAKKLRKSSGDENYYAPIERLDTSAKARVKMILVKPFDILFREPMLMAVTLYMSFVYGILYLLFEAYPIVFTQGHHMSEGISGLMFLPLFIGGICAVITYIFYFNKRYIRIHHKYSHMDPPQPVPPEVRLEMALIGSWMFVIALFWFGWTSFPSISYWSPLLAGGMLGWAILYLFLSLFNYIIEVYLMHAASALSATTVVRSLFGAGFPLFATQMFEKLNPRWAATLLGCLALLLAPIPILFTRYGIVLRKRSVYSPFS